MNTRADFLDSHSVMKAVLFFLLVTVSVISNLYWFKPNHDAAWLLLSAQRWLEGGTYTENFMEINPPMAIVAYMPAVFLSKVTALPLLHSGLLYVTLLALLSVYLVHRVIHGMYYLSPRDKWFFLLICLSACLFAPGFHFAQREHIAFLLMLPFIIYTGKCFIEDSTNSNAFYLLLVTLAAIGSTIKPTFLTLVPTFILLQVVRQRSVNRIFSSDTAIFLLVVVGYSGLLLIDAFGYQPVMLYVSKLYGAYEESPVKVLFRGGILLLIIGLLHGFARRYLKNNKAYAMLIVTLVSQCIFLFSFFIQQKGWLYHALPIVCLFVVEVGWLIVLVRKNAQNILFRPVEVLSQVPHFMIVVLLSLGLLGINTAVGQSHLLKNYLKKEDVQFISNLPENASIYWFTTDLSKAFPIVAMGNVTWASRYPHQWLLAGLKGVEESGTESEDWVREAKTKLYRDMVNDFVVHKPDYVFVDTGKKMLGLAESIDFIEWFSQDSGFREIWSHYQQISELGHIRIYALESSDKVIHSKTKQ